MIEGDKKSGLIPVDRKHENGTVSNPGQNDRNLFRFVGNSCFSGGRMIFPSPLFTRPRHIKITRPCSGSTGSFFPSGSFRVFPENGGKRQVRIRLKTDRPNPARTRSLRLIRSPTMPEITRKSGQKRLVILSKYPLSEQAIRPRNRRSCAGRDSREIQFVHGVIYFPYKQTEFDLLAATRVLFPAKRKRNYHFVNSLQTYFSPEKRSNLPVRN